MEVQGDRIILNARLSFKGDGDETYFDDAERTILITQNTQINGPNGSGVKVGDEIIVVTPRFSI